MAVRHGKLKSLGSTLGVVDVFIGSASFESRCQSVPTNLELSTLGSALIGLNLTYREAVQAHFDALKSRLGEKLVPLPLYSADPIKSIDSIAAVVGPQIQGEAKRLVLDITTFTRESLIILLGYLYARLRKGDAIQFVYAHAKDYSVGDEPDKKWLSKGISDVRSVLGFPGKMVPSKKIHLIVMVGFEDERAYELIRECEPTFLSLGIGDAGESGTAPHQATNIHRFRRLRSVFGPADEFAFSAYDPIATRESLKEQIRRRPDCNVVIAPMNTKISTTGAVLAALENSAVQLCYAPANIYNVANYSTPDDDYYLFDLPEFSR